MSWSAASSSHWTAATSAAWQQRQRQQPPAGLAAVAARLAGVWVGLGVPEGSHCLHLELLDHGRYVLCVINAIRDNCGACGHHVTARGSVECQGPGASLCLHLELLGHGRYVVSGDNIGTCTRKVCKAPGSLETKN
jgi:hypothetical protein